MLTDSLMFLLSQIPWKAILFGLVALLSLATAINLSAYLIIQMMRLRWRLFRTIRYIHLQNCGNLSSAFQIESVSPGRELEFRFFVDGTPLPPVIPLPEPEPPPETVPTAQKEPPPTYAATYGLPAQPQAQPVQTAEPPKPAADKDQKPGLLGTVKKIRSKSRLVVMILTMTVSLLNTLAFLIPGPVGQSIGRKAKLIQSGLYRADAAVAQPRMKMQSAQILTREAGQIQSAVGVKKGPASPKAEAQPAAAGPATALTHVSTPVAAPQSQKKEPAKKTVKKTVGMTAQTPEVGPEDTLVVEMWISPRNPYRAGEFVYWLLTRQASRDDIPEPVKNVQQIRLTRPSLLYLPAAVLGATGIIIGSLSGALWLTWQAARLLIG